MSKDNKITTAHVLVPLSLLAFVVFVLMAFQTTQIMHDRTTLTQDRAQQNKPLEDAHKVQSQLEALAFGTKKLAQGGNKSAAAIIANMEKAGISVGGSDQKAGTTPPAPMAVKPALAPAPAPAAPAADSDTQ